MKRAEADKNILRKTDRQECQPSSIFFRSSVCHSSIFFYSEEIFIQRHTINVMLCAFYYSLSVLLSTIFSY